MMLFKESNKCRVLTEYIGPETVSLDEAREIFEDRVLNLPVGSTFTIKQLMRGVELRGDSRGMSGVLAGMRSRGVIVCAGVSREGQETRNKGYATLWRRVE